MRQAHKTNKRIKMKKPEQQPKLVSADKEFLLI